MPVIRNLIELSGVSSNTTYSASSPYSKILGVVNNARYEGDDDNSATRIVELNDTKHDGGILYIGGVAYRIEVITPEKKSAVTLTFENGSSKGLYGDGGSSSIAFIKAIPVSGGPVRYFAALDDSTGSLPPIKSISTGILDFDPAGHDVKINLSTTSNVITIVPDVQLANDAFRVLDTDVLNGNLLANDKGSNLSVTALNVNGSSKAVGSTFTAKTEGGFDVQVTVNANGAISVDPSDALAAALKLGQTDILSLTYTAGGKTANATVTIDGSNTITAVADSIKVPENERFVFSLTANDLADSGSLAVQSVTYRGVTYAVGQIFQIVAENGATAPAQVNAAGTLVLDSRGQAFGDIAEGQVVNIDGLLSYTIVDTTDPSLTSTASVSLQIVGSANPIAFVTVDDAITSTDDFSSIIYNVLGNDNAGSNGNIAVTGLTHHGVALEVGVEQTFTTEGGLQVLGTLLPTGQLVLFGDRGTIKALAEGQTDQLKLSYEARLTTASGQTAVDTADVNVTFTGTSDAVNRAPIAVADTMATGRILSIGIEERLDITDQIIFNDRDPDGDAISINDVIISGNSDLEFTVEDGRLFISSLGNAYDYLDGTTDVARVQFSYSLVDEYGAVSNYARADVFIYDL